MRYCLFCDKRANTREHILPDWMLDHFRAMKRDVRLTFDLEGQHRHGIKITPGIRVKRVCSDCNSKWMSNLESSSKPLLGSMLHDVTTPIDTLQQTTLARWALKTAMVMESIGNRVHPFHTQKEREELRTSFKIPKNTYIWLARYAGANDIAYIGMHLWNDKPDDPKTIHCYVNTVAIGYVALQVFSAHVPNGHPRINVAPFPAPWGKLLVKIWPTANSSLVWPPEFTFSDTGFMALGDLVERFKPIDATVA
jgi:hypothetical protein